MSLSRFKCDCCGLCCRLIGNIPQLKRFDRGDGTCCHLTAENLCDIYVERPEVCRVDKMYSHFKDLMTEGEYVDSIEESCRMLKTNYETLRGSLSGSPAQSKESSDAFRDDFERLAQAMPGEVLSRLAEEVVM